MQTRDIGGYDIKLPKHGPQKIETPPDQIGMHALVIATAKRGGGKTVAVTNLCKNLVKDKALDRLLVVSPTWGSNKHMFEGLPVEESDIHHEPGPPVVPDVVGKVEEEMKDWKAYKEKAKLRKQLEAALRACRSDADIINISPQLLIDAFNLDVFQQPPKHKYNGKRPVLGLFIDDSQATKLFNSAAFQNMVLKHRHIGDGLGISIFMAVQTYSAQTGGMPKALRENCTHLLLFRTKSQPVLKQIAEENDLSEDQFMPLYEYATGSDDHDFLFIDFNPKTHDRKFRKNFNQYIVVPKDVFAEQGGADQPAPGGLPQAGQKHGRDGHPIR